jgi:dienelactone hydrolase
MTASRRQLVESNAELTRFNKAHEFYSYPNAGHAFMDGTKESYRRHADEASWPRALEFLDRHLGLAGDKRATGTR